MTQKEKNHLFARLLPEYRDLFVDMDDLNRTLWFAVNEENELMSFIVRSCETADQAIEHYKAKLLAIAAALESLPCAAAELRHMAGWMFHPDNEYRHSVCSFGYCAICPRRISNTMSL